MFPNNWSKYLFIFIQLYVISKITSLTNLTQGWKDKCSNQWSPLVRHPRYVLTTGVCCKPPYRWNNMKYRSVDCERFELSNTRPEAGLHPNMRCQRQSGSGFAMTCFFWIWEELWGICMKRSFSNKM